jgi:protein TonB
MKAPITRLKTDTDLRNTYFLRLEIGFILSLLIAIFAFRVNINLPEAEDELYVQIQEEVYLDEVVRTKQIETAPPPPRPMVPVEVPNDEILVDEFIDLDTELDLDAAISLPATPPPVAAKAEEEEEEEIFVVVEQMPELLGGLAAIQKDIVYPKMAILAQIQGRVIVQFIIDKEGNVKNPTVVRGIGGGCDEEALRVIKQAKFKPGMQRGKPVSVKYSIPVVFNLTESSKKQNSK